MDTPEGYAITTEYLAKLIYDLLGGDDPEEAGKALEEGGWVDENGEWIYDDD